MSRRVATLALVLLLEQLVMRGAGEELNPPKTYLQPERNMMFKINDSVKLPREAHGNATPVYTWKRQDSPFDPSANAYRYTLTPNTGTLIINRLQAEDDGTYKKELRDERVLDER